MKKPVDIKISENLQLIFDGVDDCLRDIAGDNIGISLVVFNKEPGARLNYISNCERKYVLAVFKSLVKGWEKGMPDIPAHEYKG